MDLIPVDVLHTYPCVGICVCINMWVLRGPKLSVGEILGFLSHDYENIAYNLVEIYQHFRSNLLSLFFCSLSLKQKVAGV
jgi:hypothetical protein